MQAGVLSIDFETNIARIASDVQSASRSITGSVKGVQEAFESAKKAAEAFAVGFGVERFVEFIAGALEAAAALEKLSQRTGMSTESLSQLQYAAKLAEVPTDSLTTAMKKLAVSISQGMAGDQQKIALFKQMGISQADLGKGTQAVMMQMANAYAHAQDGAGKAAVSIALMGKAGDEMIPFLNQGASGIRALTEEADRLGLTIGTDFAEQAAQFHDNLTRINAMSGKLAITLAQDLVQGTSRAMQAFIDAAREGNKFAGTIAFIQTLLTGDDLHKANVTLVEDTDKLLAAQNDLDRLKRQGYADDSMAVQSQKAKIAGLQDEINTSLTYKRSLEGQADAAKAAAEATKKHREEGDKWQAASKQAIAQANAEAAAFRSIAKSVAMVIDTTTLELKQGTALTEYQKLAIKTEEAEKNSKVALTQAHKDEIAARLASAKALLDEKAIRDAQMKDAKTFSTEWGKANQEQADFDKARADEGYRVTESIRQQTVSLSDNNRMLEAESLLVAASDRDRATALGQLQIQLALERQIYDIKHDEMLTAEDRKRAIALATANAEQARLQVAKRAALQEQITLMGQIESTGKQMWDILWQGGSDTFKKLGQALKTYLLDLLYQMTAKPWVLSFAASMTGGMVAPAAGMGSSAMGAGLSSMFGAGGLGGSLLAGAGWLTGSTSLTGALSAAGSLMASGTAAGFMSGLGMAAGALGPIALGAVALASVFGGKGGGPKANGSAGAWTGLGSGEQDSSAMSAVQAMQQSYAQFLSAVGGASAAGLTPNFGFGISTDPKGTAPSFVGSSIQAPNGGFMYYDVNHNVGRDQASLQAAIQEQSMRAVLAALQQSDLPSQIQQYLSRLDPMKASSDEITKAIQLTQEVGTFWKTLDALGNTFVSLKSLSIEGADGLIKLAGGLQSLTSQLDSYYKDFYSKSEQDAQMTRNIAQALSAAGLQYTVDQITAMTREQFRALVDHEMALGDAGTQALAALLSVEKAFSDTHPEAAATATAVAAVGAAASTATDALTLLKDALTEAQKGTDAAMTALKNSVAAEKAAVQSQLSTTDSAVQQMQSMFALLEQQANAMYGGVSSTGRQQAAQGQAVIDAAIKSGVLPSQAVMQQAISDVQRQIAATTYASQFEKDRSQLVLAGQIATLRDMASSQLTDAQRQQVALQEQLKALDQIAATAQQQIDAVRGVDDSVKSVAQAVQDLAAALNVERRATVAAAAGGVPGVKMPLGGGVAGFGADGAYTDAGGNTYSAAQIASTRAQAQNAYEISTLYMQLLGRTEDLGAMNYYGNTSAADVKQAILNSDEYKARQASGAANPYQSLFDSGGLPSFDVGTNFLPRDMVARVHRGEAIVPARYNPAAGGTSASERHLQRMAERLDALAQTTAKHGRHLEVISKAFSGNQQMPLLVQTV